MLISKHIPCLCMVICLETREVTKSYGNLMLYKRYKLSSRLGAKNYARGNVWNCRFTKFASSLINHVLRSSK